MKWVLIILLFCLPSSFVYSWDFWGTLESLWGESCSSFWLPHDVEGLRNVLRQRVFGQPFLEKSLIPILKHHLRKGHTPKKALALSFHGGPGVGKTFVSQIIAKFLFKEGEHSKYYKLFSPRIDFEDEISFRRKIIETVKQCDRALFVFDEVENLPDGILGAIKTFLDYHSHIDKVDYRKSIFIFISNIGMERINSLSLEHWKEGIPREKFNLPSFENAIWEPVFNERSGLKRTKVVKNYLIDLYVPFLPLEREHVRKCIKVEGDEAGFNLKENDINEILYGLNFLPTAEKIYASSGCKVIDNGIISRIIRDEL